MALLTRNCESNIFKSGVYFQNLVNSKSILIMTFNGYDYEI